MRVLLKKILQKPYYLLRILYKVRWLKTLRVNFALLPFKQAVRCPIIVTGKLLVGSLKGKVVFDCPIEFGLVNMGKDLDNMPIAVNSSRLLVDGLLLFKGPCIITQSSNLVVWRSGKIEIGKYVVISSGVLLKSECGIIIGDFTRLTSGCFVMDTNVHAIKDVETGRIKRIFSPIEIGKCCWLTMYTSIMPGTKLPDYCITGRYSQLNKDYSKICESGSMLAGAPAKVVKTNIQRLSDIKYERQVVVKYFTDNPDADYYQGEPGFEILKENSVASHFRI